MTAVLLALALAAPSSFVALDEVDPTILQDVRYATAYNFVGRRIDGYREPVCILTRRAARALKRAQDQLQPEGYTLKVYDYFDARAATLNSRGRARSNRLLLKRTMEAAGFKPYAKEWWHFTLRDERYPDRYFDFPVQRRGVEGDT